MIRLLQMKKTFRKLVGIALVFLILCLNQASCYLLQMIWRFDPLYYLLMVFVISFTASLVIRDFKIGLPTMIASLIFGLVISFILLMTPNLIYGRLEVLGLLWEVYIVTATKLLVLGIPVSLVGVLIGGLLFGEV